MGGLEKVTIGRLSGNKAADVSAVDKVTAGAHGAEEAVDGVTGNVTESRAYK
jgi:hypothetical protein